MTCLYDDSGKCIMYDWEEPDIKPDMCLSTGDCSAEGDIYSQEACSCFNPRYICTNCGEYQETDSCPCADK